MVELRRDGREKASRIFTMRITPTTDWMLKELSAKLEGEIGVRLPLAAVYTYALKEFFDKHCPDAVRPGAKVEGQPELFE